MCSSADLLSGLSSFVRDSVLQCRLALRIELICEGQHAPLLALRVDLICEGQCAPVQTSSQG